MIPNINNITGNQSAPQDDEDLLAENAIAISQPRNDASRNARTQLVALSNNVLCLKQKTIDSQSFKKLLLNNRLDKDTHYTVESNLYFNDVPELTELLCPITIMGNCTFENCPNLTQLPNNLIVKGNLSISECHKLRSLPDILDISDNCELFYNDSLTKLPNNLTVGHKFHVKKCKQLSISGPSLTHLGDYVEIE